MTAENSDRLWHVRLHHSNGCRGVRHRPVREQDDEDAAKPASKTVAMEVDDDDEDDEDDDDDDDEPAPAAKAPAAKVRPAIAIALLNGRSCCYEHVRAWYQSCGAGKQCSTERAIRGTGTQSMCRCVAGRRSKGGRQACGKAGGG